MKTKLHLINVNTDIDLMKKYEDNFISELVHKDFTMFTEGTNKDYRCADKLLYVDNIRNRLHINNFNDYVDDYVQRGLIINVMLESLKMINLKLNSVMNLLNLFLEIVKETFIKAVKKILCITI